ncbi:alpha/beta fold hydrolase [Pseudonocardia alaniniphila]|uniref:Alpha/beta hydrolase n=1 Tax=Pseudonocardia alaniniphila TaxID=75291 RepID=A0ABS9T6D5_9PSEU|nr:alpha/beta hydrolase [Pseudonocardia alaniniphila]MCH6164051.1 alpha/beta hydrolase [Pseudonocardia alaniniphila]
MIDVHHRTTTVNGHEIFYREAGPADAPVVLLLHGFPTSSRMFRKLIPALADRYHLIAPDHLGFGHSATPSADEFTYTFDALTDITQGLLDQLGVDRFTMYVQDYGAPIGWRLALRQPARVQTIISQSGNAYDDGFVPDFWAPIWAYAQAPGPDTERPLRGAFELDAIRWQYLTGVPEPDLVDPDTWLLDHSGLLRPGNDRIQLDLFRDYATNPPLYPAVQEYFRTSQVPTLAVWGAGDEIFGPDGATAFRRDLPDAEIHLVQGGHFLLESALDTVTGYIRGFLGRTLTGDSPQRSGSKR